MDPFSLLSVLVSAVIAAVVSLAVTLGFRWWDRRTVNWVLTGEAHHHYSAGRPSGLVKANIVIHNAGDGDAYDVRVTGFTGDAKEWSRFIAAKVSAGESVEQEVFTSPEDFPSSWVEVTGLRSPTHARLRRVGKRWHLTELGPLGDGPPRAVH